ncbi:MAG: DUF2442 domain-containing protein [bacterium]|nr:DUF2442 domain-containing protein [bacterium]
MNPNVIRIIPTDNHTILLEFDNDEVREFDVKPYLDKGIFIELQKLDYFRTVRIVARGIEWPNEQDFSFDTLYMASKPIKSIQGKAVNPTPINSISR